MNRSFQRKAAFALIVVVLVAAVSEAGAYLAIRYVQRAVDRGHSLGILMDRTNPFGPDDAARYFRVRDPLLGWPTTDRLRSDRHGPDGARPGPAHPYPEPPCAAAFGDSFTWSAEVGDAEAWPNRLSALLGCRVANYGVGGYGTDQAYLRFARTELGPASVVILGLFPENIQRNVNQARGFLGARHWLLFKPRFVLGADGESLDLVPPVGEGGFDYARLLREPEAFLSHEYFLPGGRFGPIFVDFPFTLTALRALLHPRSRAALTGGSTWAELYRPGNESGALPLLQAILKRFAADARRQGRHPLVVVYTDARSVRAHLATGAWPYQSVLDFLAEAGIDTVHFGDHVAEYMEPADFCDIMTQRTLLGCLGHYTPAGYEMVARIVHRHLAAAGLLAPPPVIGPPK